MDRFMLEINRAKKFDEYLKNLSNSHLRECFKEIKASLLSVRNWRHDIYENNKCILFPDRKKEDLKNYIRFGGFTDAHIDIVVALISEFSEDQSYDKLVLVPEALSLLIENIFDISHDDAETYLTDGGIDFVHRYNDQWLSRWLSKCIGIIIIIIINIFYIFFLFIYSTYSTYSFMATFLQHDLETYFFS